MVPMDKKSTDRAINRWFLRCVFGPVSLFTLSAFMVGYWFPENMTAVQAISQRIGLHYLVGMRTVGSEFNSAAYFYWLAFWIMLPFNLGWFYLEGIKQNMPTALRTVAQANLKSRLWNPSKYTLRGGYMRLFGFVLFIGSLLVVQLVTAREPSNCKGCETTSVLGFVLINWLGTYVLLLASYFACSYLIFWKSICTSFEEYIE